MESLPLSLFFPPFEGRVVIWEDEEGIENGMQIIVAE